MPVTKATKGLDTLPMGTAHREKSIHPDKALKGRDMITMGVAHRTPKWRDTLTLGTAHRTPKGRDMVTMGTFHRGKDTSPDTALKGRYNPLKK